MDTLTLTTVCVLCATPAPVVDHTGTWQPLIAEAASRFSVPPAWIAKVLQAESGGHITLNGQRITSKAGAMGLMQLMPQTYANLRLRYGFGPDAYAPRDNIMAGAAYLREMYVRYGYPNLFAAYNAGPGRLDRFLLTHAPLPAETLRYVDAIIPAGSLAFGSKFTDTGGAKATPFTTLSTTPASLFVALNAPATIAAGSLKSLPTVTQFAGARSPTVPSSRPTLFVTLTAAAQ